MRHAAMRNLAARRVDRTNGTAGPTHVRSYFVSSSSALTDHFKRIRQMSLNRSRLHAMVACVLAVSVAMPLVAQESTSQASVHPTPPVTDAAVKRTGSITVDGKLDDPAWGNVPAITNFRQYQPAEGQPATQRTEVRIIYDADAIYVGARMYDSLGAKGARAPLARRDQLLDSNGNNGSFNSLTTDKLVVILDPYHNHIDRALFEVNPAGVKGDQFDGDDSWDPVWEAAAHVDSLGWTAEMRIPYSQLRFSRAAVQTWGLELWRYEDRLNERDMWAWYSKSAAGGPAFYGHLTGLEIPPQPKTFELLPYVVTGEKFARAAVGDPYHGNTTSHLSAGADLKYLLTSNLTLDATFNPDFGQVEVDPATINLSAYETYYDEKRPFFIAGSSAFDFGGMNCMFCSNTSGMDVFYSRRIGRPPQLTPWVNGNSEFANTPDNTSILGAAKITGRTAGGYTVGVLDALTNQETARYVLPNATNEQLTQTVEPLTNYFVGRVKKDFRQGATTFGGIFTSTDRRIDDSIVDDRLRSHAQAAGIDWDHTWHRQDYSWMGNAVVSNVNGSTSAMDLTQLSSAHYYQRPDRRVTSDGLFSTRYDPNATSMQGYGFYTRLAKQSGDWMWETAQNWRSPGFEVNDLAYLDRADYKWMNFNVMRQWTKPTTAFQSMALIAGGQQKFNYDGIRTDEQAQAYFAYEFPNYWNLRSFWIYHPITEDDRLTRGGPVVDRQGYNLGHFQVSTDARGRAVFNIAVEMAKGIGSHTHTFSINPGVALKPASNVFVSLTPSYVADEDDAQYVTRVSDPTATAFYGNRYVFGFIRTHTLSLDTRVNWTFTPNLTLQLFAQPFVATGDYGSFREFAAPRTIRKYIYGKTGGTIAQSADGSTYTVDPDGAGPAQTFTFANPNFTNRQLIGNAVLRWEYRPGSTVFFVWTQNRSGYESTGDFDFSRERTAFFRDRPTNVFQIKVNYWIGR